jgi:hypothetical protein
MLYGYVLREDGTVGFVDTMQDPGKIDRQAASDLLSFMIGLLAHDQEIGRASSWPGRFSRRDYIAASPDVRILHLWSSAWTTSNP